MVFIKISQVLQFRDLHFFILILLLQVPQSELVKVWVGFDLLNFLSYEKRDFFVWSSSQVCEKINPLAPPEPDISKSPAKSNKMTEFTK